MLEFVIVHKDDYGENKTRTYVVNVVNSFLEGNKKQLIQYAKNNDYITDIIFGDSVNLDINGIKILLDNDFEIGKSVKAALKLDSGVDELVVYSKNNEAMQISILANSSGTQKIEIINIFLDNNIQVDRCYNIAMMLENGIEILTPYIKNNLYIQNKLFTELIEIKKTSDMKSSFEALLDDKSAGVLKLVITNVINYLVENNEISFLKSRLNPTKRFSVEIFGRILNLKDKNKRKQIIDINDKAVADVYVNFLSNGIKPDDDVNNNKLTILFGLSNKSDKAINVWFKMLKNDSTEDIATRIINLRNSGIRNNVLEGLGKFSGNKKIEEILYKVYEIENSERLEEKAVFANKNEGGSEVIKESVLKKWDYFKAGILKELKLTYKDYLKLEALDLITSDLKVEHNSNAINYNYTISKKNLFFEKIKNLLPKSNIA